MCRDKMTPLPTNDRDFVNHPVVSCLKSGKWVAKIQHPIRKVCVCVGIYSTPQEAADACTRKKLEYESRSEQEKAASFPTDVTNFDKHMGVRRIKSGNDASDVYNLSKLELDSQKMICSGKAGAVYSTESAMLKAADKRPVKADAEQSVKLYRPRHAYRAKAGRWRTEIRHPIIKGKKIHLGSFDTAQEAANAYHSIRHDFELMFPGYKKIKQSNNSCQAEAFAEGNSDSTCLSGDPQAEEAYNNKMHEVDLIVRAHRKRTLYNGSCEAAAVVEGISNSTCTSVDPSVSTRVHLGTCTEEAEDDYNNTMHEFDLMVHAHIKRKQSKGSYKVDAVVESKSNPAFVSDEPSVSTRVHLDTFTEQTDTAYNKCKQSKDSCDLGEQSQKNQRLSHVYPTKGGRWRTEIGHPITKARVRLGTFGTAEEAKEAYDSKRREFDSMFPGHYKRKQSMDSFDLGLKANAEQSQRLKYVYPRKSGRWTTEIRHPITKATIRLGTFDTAEEAKEAYDSKRREFDSMFPSHKTKDSRDLKAGPEQSQKIQRPCCAEEASNSNRREFHLMLPVNTKLKQLNDSCKGDAIAEGKSYSTCVSDDPSGSSDGSLVIKTGREEETRGSMLNENVQSVPMFVTEERGEFDSDVIDSYGQLVGEYSRLDDELWLCRSEDDATLEHDDGHECC